MQHPKRRKDDENSDPIVDLYNLIASYLGHAVAARVIEILALADENEQ